jgi:hypothetical protein
LLRLKMTERARTFISTHLSKIGKYPHPVTMAGQIGCSAEEAGLMIKEYRETVSNPAVEVVKPSPVKLTTSIQTNKKPVKLDPLRIFAAMIALACFIRGFVYLMDYFGGASFMAIVTAFAFVSVAFIFPSIALQEDRGFTKTMIFFVAITAMSVEVFATISGLSTQDSNRSQVSEIVQSNAIIELKIKAKKDSIESLSRQLLKAEELFNAENKKEIVSTWRLEKYKKDIDNISNQIYIDRSEVEMLESNKQVVPELSAVETIGGYKWIVYLLVSIVITIAMPVSASYAIYGKIRK